LNRSFILLVIGGGLAGPVGYAQSGSAQAKPATAQSAEAKFDPARDAAKDIRDAVAEARRTGRRVILDVGGEWCGWCHTLDRYFVEHPELKEARDRLYVWTKVNYSTENRNEAVLSRYPKINGYPHLFVLDKDGQLLHSQDTSLLEEGSSYNYDRMQAFLMRWSGQDL
jgi:thiol:disulfide interchange protein